MIVILVIVLLFHFLVLSQIINFKNSWGGRLSGENQMYLFETISLCLNALLLFSILQKANYIKQYFSTKVIETILWIFVFIFSLNTVGNLFASNLFEKILGTIFTSAAAYLCTIIVRKNKKCSTSVKQKSN